MKTDSGDGLKSRTQFGDEAIQLAIQGRWEEAVELNRQILERFGADEDTHNRLGKALTELGRLDEAKAAYSETLTLNQFNVIARKNVVKLDTLLAQKSDLKGGPVKVDLNLFVEEMGKTVVTLLEDVTDPNVCDHVVAGDVAELRVDGDTIVGESVRGVRLGTLEAKLARRLIKFIQGGNRYQAGVVACEDGQVKVILREVYQDPQFAGKPSFPMKRQRAVEFRPYAKESLIPRDAVPFATDDEDETEAGLESTEEEYEGMRVEDDEEGTDDVDFSDDLELGDDEGGDGDDDEDSE